VISGAPEEIPLTVDGQPAMPCPRWGRAAPAIWGTKVTIRRRADTTWTPPERSQVRPSAKAR